MQVVLAGRLVERPGGAAEGGQPVVRRRPSGFGSRQTYQSRFGLSRDARDSDEPRVLVGRVVRTKSRMTLMPRGVRLLDQRVEVGQRAEQRVDVAVVGDVVAEVGHRRRDRTARSRWRRRRASSGSRAVGDAAQVADAVAVAVLEAARVDLVDDAALPPRKRVSVCLNVFDQ